MFGGLWFGKEKPFFSTFFKTFVGTLRETEIHGKKYILNHINKNYIFFLYWYFVSIGFHGDVIFMTSIELFAIESKLSYLYYKLILHWRVYRYQKFLETSFWLNVSDSWETIGTTFWFCKFCLESLFFYKGECKK